MVRVTVRPASKVESGRLRAEWERLAADGLVAWRPLARGRGRPTHLYRLTRAAEPLFPKAYGGLTTELLGYVADADPDLVLDRLAVLREGALR